jgi:hypothetical protein
MDQEIKQKILSFSTSENTSGAIELLKLCRTKLYTVVDKSEFQTVVNALTLESESNLIGRLISEIEKIKTGDISILNG